MSLRQLDAIRMFLVALMIMGEHLLQPVSLAFRGDKTTEGRILTDEELLATALTPDAAHHHESLRQAERLEERLEDRSEEDENRKGERDFRQADIASIRH